MNSAVTPLVAIPREQLVGRAAELSLVDTLLSSFGTKAGTLLMLGEPGVGRSALLAAAAQTARERGVLVLEDPCVEREGEFSSLRRILGPLQDALDLLDPGLRASLAVACGWTNGPSPDQLTVSNAVLQLLRSASSEQRVLSVVDDMHWMDARSSKVMGFVAHRLLGSPVGFLASMTADAPFPGGARQWHVIRPLDDEASDLLLTTRRPGLGESARRRVLAEADGNPLALLELSGAGAPASAPGRSDARLSTRVRALFSSRIDGLPAGSRRLLLLAALDGTGDFSVLTSARCTVEDLAPLEAARLIRLEKVPFRLIFENALTRAAVVTAATEEEQQEGHRILAEAAADPEYQAWHLAAAAARPDREVAQLLEEAASRALHRGDDAGAVAALGRAAELSVHEPDRERLLVEAAYLDSLAAGVLGPVPRVLGDARLKDLGGSAVLRIVCAEVTIDVARGGDLRPAQAQLADAIAQHDGPWDSSDEALVAALSLALFFYVHSGREQVGFFDAAFERFGSTLPTDLYLMSRFVVDPLQASQADLDSLEHEVRLLSAQTDPLRVMRIAASAARVDRLGGCRVALQQMVETSGDGVGVPLSLTALWHLLGDDVWTGRWDQADVHATEALERSYRSGYIAMEPPIRHFQSLLAAMRGDVDEALATSDAMSRWADLRGSRVGAEATHWVRGALALGQGDDEDAYHHLCAAAPAGDGLVRPYSLVTSMDRVDAAVRTGRRAEAEGYVDLLRASTAGSLSSRLALLVAGSEAMVAGPDVATRRFETALALVDVDRWPFDLARVRLSYGEHLRRVRSVSEARVQLVAAHDLFRRLGAEPWATRALSELRAAGLPVGAGTPRASTATALSPQEREIAQLAAAGLTNREIGLRLFLSPRTVGAHLYRTFPKLGITSRAALRDSLRDSGSEPSPSREGEQRVR